MFAASKTASVSGGYQISRSLRFNSADSAYLNRTPASAGNKQTWTLSAWVKRGSLGAFNPIYSAGATSPRAYIIFNSSDKMDFRSVDSGNTEVIRLTTTQVFRDPSAWYHIVVAQDTTQATSSNRVKIYVNGTQITAFDTATYPSQNISNLAINDALEQNYGRYVNSPSDGYLSAYLTETNFIDGSQLTPSSFGETNAQTGVWQPKAYSGSYGTNGFYLNFSDNSNTTAATLGKDYSGNGNNWIPFNFSVTAGAGNDSLVDSPTSYGTDTGVGGTVRGNYCTWNPLDIQNSVLSLTNGNLDFSGGTTGFIGSRGTIGMTSGKWYWEITAGGSGNVFGIMTSAATTVGIDFYPGRDAYGWGYYGGNGNKFNNNSGTAYGATFTNGDVIGIAFDADAGTLVFYKNGTSQGTAFSSLTSGPYFPAFGESATTGSTNFGQRPFAYTAPSGYKALCTQNLPTPAIGATTATQAALYFTPTTYTGNGSASRAITNGINMSANGGLVWSKQRSGVEWHFLIDNVRGNTKYLSSNATNAEGTISTLVTSFDSTGYSIGNDSGINANGSTYVSWVWGAGGSGSTNTAGSITSTVSANTTSGFSIVTYTGNGTSLSTVGHGLGAVPSMVIVKARSASGLSWYVYQKDVGNTKFLELNSSAAPTTFNLWESTNPTSSVFTISNNAAINGSGTTFVAYCFAPVAGYSAMGTYTGNGSADGVFVFTGFRPAYVMVKPSSAAGSWWINDNKRDTYNVNDHRINANTSDAEATAGFTQQDFLSNGFKWRNSDSAWNGSGVTYIYMAFAENPFKYSLAR